jgi:hypothetical protein
MAVTEPVATNSFLSDISQQLLNDGSSIADRLKAQFVTTTNSTMNKSYYLYLNKFIFIVKIYFILLKFFFNFFFKVHFILLFSKTFGKRNQKLNKPSTWKSQQIIEKSILYQKLNILK